MEKEREIDISVKLEQAQAMNEMLKDCNRQQNETIKHMKHIIISLICCFFLTICIGFCGFVLYESQFEYTATEEYTEEMTTEGDNAYINNVEGSQYNDNATHTEGVE